MNRRNIFRIALTLLLLCSFLLVFEVPLKEVRAQIVSIVINDDATFTGSPSVTLTIYGVDNPSETVNAVRYSNDDSVRAWNDAPLESFSRTKEWTLLPGDGVKTVYYQIWWVGDFYFGQSYSDGITLDTISPTGSIVINDGAAFTDSSSVTLTLTAEDLGSGVEQVRFSNSGSGTDGWESLSSPKTWSLSPSDGGKTVYYQVKDNVGHVSILYSDTIFLDTTAPTGSIKINNDDGSTTSNSVTLQLTANDTTSGVHKVRYSNDGIWDVESWEDFSSTKAWTLSSELGSKTVYYQIIDKAQHISTFSDTIILATPPPSPTPTPTPTPIPTPTPTPTSSSPPTPTISPSASPSSTGSPPPSSEPWDGTRGMIPPEAFYATALIGLASIAAIILVAFRKPKNKENADSSVNVPSPP